MSSVTRSMSAAIDINVVKIVGAGLYWSAVEDNMPGPVSLDFSATVQSKSMCQHQKQSGASTALW